MLFTLYLRLHLLTQKTVPVALKSRTFLPSANSQYSHATVQTFLQSKYARPLRTYLIAFLSGQGLFTEFDQISRWPANCLCLRQEDLNGMRP